ncbi:MAG: T9SS type A sorting domain-containing protein [Chitinophagales bacterium]|nr:T9SS type A sorting domain-containing protein [Chitinophagales bacterium]
MSLLKKSIRVSFFIIFTLLSLFCKSQCENIELRNQNDVDNFIKNYGTCTTVNNLFVFNKDNGDISNLDSLYLIENVKETLQIFGDSTSLSLNLDGLKNLKLVDNLILYGQFFSGQLSKLQEVGGIFYTDLDTCKSDCLFPFIPNLKHIKNYLRVTAPLSEENTPNFTTGSNFSLSFERCRDSITLQVLSKRIKPENLRHLSIHFVENFDFDYFIPLDSLEELHFHNCENSNFSSLSSLNYVRDLRIEGRMTNTEIGEGLKNIKHIEKLSYVRVENNNFLESFLPTIEKIELSVILLLTSLKNLNFFDNIEPPLTNGRIQILSNRGLEDCNSIFLCKALNRYPTSVTITNNGGVCNKDEIIQYCITDVDDTEDVSLRIYPNPVSGFVKIESNQQNPDVQLYDIHGRLVKANYDKASGTLDMNDVVNGLYMLEVDVQGRKELYKIVKVE